MLTTVASLRSNIDSAVGASLEACIDRVSLSRSDVARSVCRFNRWRPKRGVTRLKLYILPYSILTPVRLIL